MKNAGGGEGVLREARGKDGWRHRCRAATSATTSGRSAIAIPTERQKLKQVVEYTARHFDEIILDDFFFIIVCTGDCGDPRQGQPRAGPKYRLALMAEVARDVVIGPARGGESEGEDGDQVPQLVRPYQFSGYNLEAEPKLFDGIYTGTETRDPVYNDQHLQPYEGYQIVRYLENVKPGANGGGWVDPPNRQYLDRYAEQLWLTLFAKAPEITLFDFRQLIDPVRGADGAPVTGYADGSRGRIHIRAGGWVSRRPGQAGGREKLQAVPFLGRGFPGELPGDAGHPGGADAGVSRGRAHGSAYGAGEVRPCDRREDQDSSLSAGRM